MWGINRSVGHWDTQNQHDNRAMVTNEKRICICGQLSRYEVVV